MFDQLLLLNDGFLIRSLSTKKKREKKKCGDKSEAFFPFRTFLTKKRVLLPRSWLEVDRERARDLSSIDPARVLSFVLDY